MNSCVMKLFQVCGLSVILALGSVGCARKPIVYDYSQEVDPRKGEYVIGFADKVQINVWRNGDLSTSGTVRPDGTITMPLIGDIRAAGRTPSQLKGEIAKKLETYVKEEAIVTVAVTEVNSYRFTVSGNVNAPGIFKSSYYVTVSEALAMGGGPNKFASAEQTVIVRPDPKTGAVRQIPVDYERIRSGAHPEQDIVVLAGDTVFVP